MPDQTARSRDADAQVDARLDALVERWFFECFEGSPVARSTEAWNHAHAAKDELRRRLSAFLAAPPSADQPTTSEA